MLLYTYFFPKEDLPMEERLLSAYRQLYISYSPLSRATCVTPGIISSRK